MIKEWLQKTFGSGTHEGRQVKPSIGEAIRMWENDHGRNPEEYKIIRGLDGKPVEVVLVNGGTEPVFAIVVNGTQEQFQIGGEMRPLEQVFGSLMFQQFLNADVFNGWYELKGIQRLDAQVSRTHQGFIFGQPGPQPLEYRYIVD